MRCVPRAESQEHAFTHAFTHAFMHACMPNMASRPTREPRALALLTWRPCCVHTRHTTGPTCHHCLDVGSVTVRCGAVRTCMLRRIAGLCRLGSTTLCLRACVWQDATLDLVAELACSLRSAAPADPQDASAHDGLLLSTCSASGLRIGNARRSSASVCQEAPAAQAGGIQGAPGSQMLLQSRLALMPRVLGHGVHNIVYAGEAVVPLGCGAAVLFRMHR